MQMRQVNCDIQDVGDDRMQKEFTYIEKFLKGHGIDVGCGTNRLSKDIVSIDQNPDKKYAHADIVHNCHDLNCKYFTFREYVYTFDSNSLDFIFSSHCLEDFEDIPIVYMNWWRKLKPNGFMILLLPDMENGRYPRCDDPQGNPSHRTDVGLGFIKGMLKTLNHSMRILYNIVQADTIPHNESCTVDIVIRKL